jgi:hypothetical protein
LRRIVSEDPSLRLLALHYKHVAAKVHVLAGANGESRDRIWNDIIATSEDTSEPIVGLVVEAKKAEGQEAKIGEIRTNIRQIKLRKLRPLPLLIRLVYPKHCGLEIQLVACI